MRKEFPGYYKLTDDRFDELWESGIIVLDSSALLHLYRYSVRTSNEFIGVLRHKVEQLWVPHHVGVEYHRNRESVIQRQRDALSKIEASVNDSYMKTEGVIRGFNRHPTLAVDEITKALHSNRKRMKKVLKKERERHSEDIESTGANESTSDAIADLFEGRVGVPHDQEALDELYKEGATRFEGKIPPGYMDAKDKTEPERYGDLVVWRQILDHAATERKGVVFVTDDLKEDWWWKVQGERRGLRPELADEFFSATGEAAVFLSPDRFLEIARAKGIEVAEESVEEVERVSTAVAAGSAGSGSLDSMDRVERDVSSARLAEFRRAFDALEQVDVQSSVSGLADTLKLYAEGLRGPSSALAANEQLSESMRRALASMPRVELDPRTLDNMAAIIKRVQLSAADSERRNQDMEWEAIRRLDRSAEADEPRDDDDDGDDEDDLPALVR